MSTVIGRGGEQINKIQQESGCKVQIAPGTVSIPKMFPFLLLVTTGFFPSGFSFVTLRIYVSRQWRPSREKRLSHRFI